MTLTILIAASSILLYDGLWPRSLEDWLLLGIPAAIFGYIACDSLVMWCTHRKWEIPQYWYGTVIQTYTIRSKGRKTRNYHIRAMVNGKEMDGVCYLETYRRAKKGERVVLFTFRKDVVYCVHPDQN